MKQVEIGSIIKWSFGFTNYEVLADGKLKSVDGDNPGELFSGHALDYLQRQVDRHMVVIVSKPTPKPIDTLQITVDSSQLASALAMAKELEATMLRIKGLFVS